MKYILLFFFFIKYSLVFSQWEPTNGPFGGNVYAIAFSQNSNNLYIGTNNYPDPGAGVFRSMDMAESWSKVTSGIENFNVRSLECFGDNVLAGSEKGIFLSTNQGTTWDSVNGIPSPGFTNDFELMQNKIFAATNNDVYMSSDNGVSWEERNIPFQGYSVKKLTSLNNTLLAAATSGKIFKTTNFGINWVFSNESMVGVNFVDALITEGSTIYAGTNRGVYKSDNEGASWLYISTGLPGYNVSNLTSLNGILFASIDNDVYKSTNNGLLWLNSSDGLTEYSKIVSMDVANGYVIAGAIWDNGVYVSSNGGSNWIQKNNGIMNLKVNDLYSNGAYLYAGTLFGRGIYRTQNDGLSWLPCNNGLNDVVVNSITSLGPNLFVSNYMILKSTNNGDSWFPSNSGLPQGGILCLASSGNFTFAGFDHSVGLYRSSDFGNFWQFNENFDFIKSITTENEKIVVGAENGVSYSSNSGASWIYRGLSYTSFVKLKGTKLIRGGSLGGVDMSTNYGANWTSIGASLPPLTTISSIEVSEDNVIVSLLGKGIFLSTNNGASWMEKNQGLDNMYISKLLIKDGYLFAATVGSSIWKRSLSEIVSIQNNSSILPDEFILKQNYPNPFNPTTNIIFSITEKSIVKLKIINVSGQIISELINEELEAGTYNYDFDGVDYPSGVYFYRLETEKFSETKRMILLK